MDIGSIRKSAIWTVPMTAASPRADRRPRIGLVADNRIVTMGAWTDLEACVVPRGYVQAIAAAGGSPIVIPVDECHVEDPASAIEMLDGLALIGGRDLDPERYGQDPHEQTDVVDGLGSVRDRLELSLAALAVKLDLPVLGICRGVQVLNVALGGDLEQHLGDRVDPTPHRKRLGEFTRHVVNARPETKLAEALGTAAVEVASHHHQGVGRMGAGLVAAATSPDGVVEALEHPGCTFCVGVLWHPEEDVPGSGLPLFRSLADAAAARFSRSQR
jgi:putative glutamine amidotransferase